VVKIKKYFTDRISKLLEIVVVLFGLFLLFQLIRKILGGSWSAEDLIIGLLLFVVGSLFTIGMMVAQLKSDHKNLKSQFRSLAEDFKKHLTKNNHK